MRRSRIARKRAQIVGDIEAMERNRGIADADRLRVLDKAIAVQRQRLVWLDAALAKTQDELHQEREEIRAAVGPEAVAAMKDGIVVGLSPDTVSALMHLALVEFVIGAS